MVLSYYQLTHDDSLMHNIIIVIAFSMQENARASPILLNNLPYDIIHFKRRQFKGFCRLSLLEDTRAGKVKTKK
jgi:hypothetical protein